MRGNRKLGVAVLTCISPFILTACMGLESFYVFAGIMAAFLLIFVVLVIAHWAIETVLVALGFNRDAINRDDRRSTIILWGN